MPSMKVHSSVRVTKYGRNDIAYSNRHLLETENLIVGKGSDIELPPATTWGVRLMVLRMSGALSR